METRALVENLEVIRQKIKGFNCENSEVNIKDSIFKNNKLELL